MKNSFRVASTDFSMGGTEPSVPPLIFKMAKLSLTRSPNKDIVPMFVRFFSDPSPLPPRLYLFTMNLYCWLPVHTAYPVGYLLDMWATCLMYVRDLPHICVLLTCVVCHLPYIFLVYFIFNFLVCND